MGTELEQWEALRKAVVEMDAGSEPGSRSDVDVCRIYDAATHTDDDHNCIGCNLRDLVSETRRVVDVITELRASGRQLEPQTEVRVAFGLLNTYWESLLNCFAIVKLHDDYTNSPIHFPIFQLVRRWTNFFKHPGPFGYKIHHPRFGYTGSPSWTTELIRSSDSKTAKLDDSYIKEFFGADAEKKKAKHLDHLRNYATAFVSLPNLEVVAEGLLAETKRALDVLTMNLFADVLASNSTIEQFYCFPEEDPSSRTGANAI
jgi:hypothetical protein